MQKLRLRASVIKHMHAQSAIGEARLISPNRRYGQRCCESPRIDGHALEKRLPASYSDKVTNMEVSGKFFETRDELVNERDAAQRVHRRVNAMAHVAMLIAVFNKFLESRCCDIGIARLFRKVVRVRIGFNGLSVEDNRMGKCGHGCKPTEVRERGEF